MIDIIKFESDSEPTNLIHAIAVSGYDSVTWIERYEKAGEFTIEAPLSSGLNHILPLGSFISHTRTFDVMIVEDHDVKETSSGDPMLKITGRSMLALFDRRTVGASMNWTSSVMNLNPFIIANNYVYQQLLTLMSTHAEWPICYDQYDDFPYIKTIAPGTPGTLESLEEREIPFGSVYDEVVKLLAVEDLGVRFVRKHAFPSKFKLVDGPYGITPSDLTTNSFFIIHDGVDQSEEVVFTTQSGVVDSAQYLWSIRNKRTAALVTGAHRQLLAELYSPVSGSDAEFSERRIMHVDGSDIDADWEDANASQRSAMEDRMLRRGLDVLQSNRQIALTSVDISRETNFRYREHYDIGDIVMVRGSYSEGSKMRIVEFAEIEDKNTYVAYPTLQFID